MKRDQLFERHSDQLLISDSNNQFCSYDYRMRRTLSDVRTSQTRGKVKRLQSTKNPLISFSFCVLCFSFCFLLIHTYFRVTLYSSFPQPRVKPAEINVCFYVYRIAQGGTAAQQHWFVMSPFGFEETHTVIIQRASGQPKRKVFLQKNKTLNCKLHEERRL